MQTITYSTTKTEHQTITRRDGNTVIYPWVVWMNSSRRLHLENVLEKEIIGASLLQEAWIWNEPHGETKIYPALFFFRSRKSAYTFWDEWQQNPNIWLTPPYPAQRLR